jgi:hypothetical protein
MAGITVARFGVDRKKNCVASLKTCEVWSVTALVARRGRVDRYGTDVVGSGVN